METGPGPCPPPVSAADHFVHVLAQNTKAPKAKSWATTCSLTGPGRPFTRCSVRGPKVRDCELPKNTRKLGAQTFADGDELVWLWANRAESRSSWAHIIGPFEQRNVDKLWPKWYLGNKRCRCRLGQNLTPSEEPRMGRMDEVANVTHLFLGGGNVGPCRTRDMVGLGWIRTGSGWSTFFCV